MSVKKLIVTLLVLMVGLLVACSPTIEGPGAGETAVPSIPDTSSDAEPVSVAQAFLAQQLGIAESEIEAVSVEPAEFSDSCLGLGQPNESCLQALTPGWIVILSANGQEYEAHTDETGQQVRIAAAIPEDDGAADTIAAAVQEFMVAELGVALGDVQVISIERTEFNDSCLGLGGPEESCLQAITPGWLVSVEVEGEPYVVHTDETGQQVRIVD